LRGYEKKEEEDTETERSKERKKLSRRKEKIDPPILLSALSLKLRSKEHLERRLSLLKNQYRYDL